MSESGVNYVHVIIGMLGGVINAAILQKYMAATPVELFGTAVIGLVVVFSADYVREKRRQATPPRGS